MDGKSRIYIRTRMYPGINISRSCGDLIAHQIGVKSEPEIRIHEILQHDKFYIIGTMGLWELLGPTEVIEIINENDFKEYGTCSEAIIHKMKESAASENLVVDDITFIISHLN